MAFRNVIDDSSTTVSAATPGLTVDLREHTTYRLRSVGVPVRFKVCVNSTAGGDTGAVKLLDSTGTEQLTCLINAPDATTDPVGDWYWVDGYLPDALAKYDVHYGGNTSGTLTVFSASVYEIDWTTDPVTGSASMTLGALTASATAEAAWIGTADMTLDAMTAAATGTVEVQGSASMTLGDLTLAATGTVVTVSPPTYQATGTAASDTGGGNDVTPTYPTHAVDDIALCIVTQYNNGSTDPGAATLTTANGFAAVTGASKLSSSGTARVRVTAFWCRATSTSMSNPVVKGISGCSLIAQIVTFRGCIASGNPWDVVSTSSNNSSDTSLAATGATTTANQTLVVAIVGGHAAATVASWANSDLTSITERSDNALNSGFGSAPLTCHVSCASGVKASAGAYGNTTATLSTSETWAAVTIALKP